MGRFIYITMFLLLFAVIAYAQQPRFTIVSIQTNTLALREDQLLEVKAILGGNPQDVTYTWDFGDGTVISGDFQEAYHLYYLEGERSKVFTVELTAVSGETTVTESTTIRVSGHRTIKIEWPLPGTLNQKGSLDSLFSINLVAYDYLGNRITEIDDFEVEFAGRKIETGQSYKGTYNAQIDLNYTVNPVEFLHAKARRGHQDNFIETMIPIYFAPAEIKVKENPLAGKNFYIGTELGKIETIFEYPDLAIVESGEFFAEITKNTTLIETLELEVDENNEFSAYSDYVFSPDDYWKEFSLQLWGKDEYGNKLELTEYPFSLSKDNPAFNLSIPPKDLQRLKTIGVGQEYRFKADILSDQEIEAAEVLLVIPELEIEEKFQKEEGEFFIEFTAPETPAENITLQFFAKGTVNGQELFDFEYVENAEITRNIEIDFIYPQENTTLFSEENMLKVNLSYPDGTMLGKETLTALLYIDGNQNNITLSLDKNKGLYFYEFEEELLGPVSIALEITGIFAGIEEIDTEIIRPMPWDFFLIGIILLVLAGIAVSFIFIRVQYLKQKHKKLSRRSAQIEEEIKSLQYSLYRRGIRPEEYKEKMLMLQNEKENIEKTLNKKIPSLPKEKIAGFSEIAIKISKTAINIFLQVKNEFQYKILPKLFPSRKQEPFEPREQKPSFDREKEGLIEVPGGSSAPGTEQMPRRGQYDQQEGYPGYYYEGAQPEQPVDERREKKQAPDDYREAQRTPQPQEPKPRQMSMQEQERQWYEEKMRQKPAYRAEQRETQPRQMSMQEQERQWYEEKMRQKLAYKESMQKPQSSQPEEKPQEPAPGRQPLSEETDTLKEVIQRAGEINAHAKEIAKEGKYSEEEQEIIDKLCPLLRPLKTKHKPGQIYRALVEEGYKPNIALGVIERLFGIE